MTAKAIAERLSRKLPEYELNDRKLIIDAEALIREYGKQIAKKQREKCREQIMQTKSPMYYGDVIEEILNAPEPEL